MARYGSDKPDLRMGQELVDCTDVLQGHAVPRLPGAVRRRGGHARRREPAAQAARRMAGVGEAARRPRPRLRPGPGGRRARRSGRQEPVRGGEGRPGRARRRAAGRLRLLRSRRGQVEPGAARCGPPRDRASLRSDRRERLELRLGRRRARCSSLRRTPPQPATSRSGRASGPRSTTPSPARRTPTPSTRTRATPWRGPTTSSATATRSAAARSVSTARTSRSGCSR